MGSFVVEGNPGQAKPDFAKAMLGVLHNSISVPIIF